MSDVDHKHILELIPAYSLNCLDAEEAELVSQHLLACEKCRVELESYRPVIDALPLAAREAEPSADLTNRHMERVRLSQVGPARLPVKPRTRSVASSWRLALDRSLERLLSSPGWRLATLGLTVVLAIGSLLLWQMSGRPDGGEPGQRQVTLTGSEQSPQARGVIYVSADDRNATLIVEGLPALGDAEQYQLWLIQDGQRANGGVFSVNTQGYGSLQIEAGQPFGYFSAFGVTVEPAGGSPGPTGVRVLGYNL